MKKYTKAKAKEVIAQNMENTGYQNDWNGSFLDAPLSADNMKNFLLSKGFGLPETEVIIASLVLAGGHFTIDN